MNNDIKELKEKIENIEKLIKDYSPLKYPLSHLLDCHIDFDLKLRPLLPTTTIEAIYIEQMEIRLKTYIHEDIESMQQKINNYLRLRI